LKNYQITHWCRNNRKAYNKVKFVKFSLKGADQILKARTEQEKKKSKQHRLFKKSKKTKN